MRIIAGSHRGRLLETPQDKTIRPTLDKTRGAIFNILEHRAWPQHPLLPTSRVADFFCGTGALGLEALSRGAAHATFVDADAGALAITRRNVEALKLAGKASLHQGDATRLAASFAPFDLIFLDPPYHKNLPEKALQHMAAKKWLKPQAVIVVETARDESFTPPPGMNPVDERGYGATKIIFLVAEG